jgi:capsular polysaccharide biosynthesis protein
MDKNLNKMTLLEKLSLPSENVIRKKPYNYEVNDKNLFKNEFIRNLPSVFPVVRKNSYLPPCGRLFNGVSFNLFQFNLKPELKGFLKLYLKSFFYLTKIRKITRFDNILYVTNSNSNNFWHWFLDVLQKLEFINQVRDLVLNDKLKIIIPIGHDNSYSKKSLEAFDLDFYFQEKNEIIVSDKSILLPDIAPTGNNRKKFVLKLSQRMRNHWMIKKNVNFDKRRIYISRKNAPKRKLKNEDEIVPILKKYGFTIVDCNKLNFEEQLKYILNSEILISSHGAGFAHMLWMKQKSKVLEIRAKDNCNDNAIFTLASDLGHDYFYVNADKTEPRKSNHHSDLVVNKKQFLSELLKML